MPRYTEEQIARANETDLGFFSEGQRGKTEEIRKRISMDEV